MMTVRSALFAAAAPAAAFGIGLALCRYGAGGNRDLAAVALEVQRGEELEPHLEARRRRHEAKRALAAEVVAGRMTLREAAARYRRLDQADPGYPPGIPRLPRDEHGFHDRILDCVWEVLAHQERFATAARWYAEVFTAHPHLLAGPPAGHRYYAARAAARAGCGQSRDAADLDETSRAGFRRQALDWLRAALAARQRLLEQEPEKNSWTVAHDLQRWLGEPDFARVRGADALGRLPEPERQAWRSLWVDVADMLARATGRNPLE